MGEHTAPRGRARARGRWQAAVLAAAVVANVGAVAQLASAAASTASATFSGGSGTVTVGDTVYAKQGGALTLSVSTPSDTTCVDVAGAFTGHKASDTAQSTWTFTTTAGAGDGLQAITATASPGVNPNGKCTGASASAQASYVLDNSGPVVAAALSPAPNAAGWNNTNTTITWSATDAGSGVASGPSPSGSPETANGVVTRTSSATDQLGNTGTGSVTIRIDKAAPSITAAQTRNQDGTTTITFTCADSDSGGAQASGIATCLADGTTTNSKTVQPGVTVTGTATDKAGNTATTSSTAPAGDTTAPTITHTFTPSGYTDRAWTNQDVTVTFTCADSGSGIASCTAPVTKTGEGKDQAVVGTAVDKAGNSASDTAYVSIDKTAPTTAISGTSNAWTNGNVTVTLTPADNLSGVASTSYAVDGGAKQSGTSVTFSTEGDHTLTYSSTDNAGNVEATQTAHVRIDKTAPTISHAFTPLTYTDGAWTNQDVTVTFTCADQGGSGVASCTAPVTTSTEGAGQQVVGTATDNAGNSATDTATVSIDKTKPTISGSADRKPNAAGWYDADVTVSFTASDALSGVASKTSDRTLGEGAAQSVTGTATDAAGNTASTTVGGLDVDETPPVLSASFTSGWHTADVTVNWSCTDALSGVATGPADDVVAGEGANLSSTASCTDKAGNTATKTVTGIEIDRTAPTTTASVPAAPATGWYTAPVQVTLTGHDNLSGVATTYYSLDGAPAQAYSAPFPVGTDGTHQVSFWSEDTAGNLETAGAPLTLHVDTTAPTTTVTDPISPDTGWFVTSGIPFAFAAEDGSSGIAATYYSIDGGATQTYGEPFTADLSTGTHTVKYWSVDAAGNKEADQSLTLKVDTIPPTIVGSQSPAPNGYGWNNTPVDVTFSCSDADSGINGVAGCAGSTTLANDGAGQTVPGDAVDVAGNRSSTTFGPVNIDTTKPTLKGVPADANAAGWHNGDVTVTWVGDDALSGIDPASQPKDSTITGEGSNLGAGPLTITDKAGNVSAPASVSGIKIDRTSPVISGGPTTQPNAAGWYKDEVTVDFTCSDPRLADGTNGSGVASCPTSKVVKGDGANQSVTSDPAVDVAGNSSAGKTVGGINIDGTAPSTTANNQCTKVNGWCTGSTANVVLTATDQAGLSGVKEIHYQVDGGTEQVAAGATKTVTVQLDGTGAGTVRYWAVDNAGNTESPNSVALKWDNIAPTVTHTLTPTANADDWNNSDVTVHFDAKDDDAGSGVDPSSVTPDVTISAETAGQVVTGTAKDTAGNVGTDSVTVKLDKTKPTITAAVTSGTKGANGWYVGPVTVTFTCSDALSGIATCPDPKILSDNGANTATGTATDKAGNTAGATLGGIDIDQEKPTLTAADVNVQGATYTLGSVPTATCTATDSFSGVASCTVTVTASSSGVGTFTYSATATDKAGNTTTITGSFRVVYRFDGFLQPINDTAHQVGTSTSIFKAGSTVPAKFQLKRADGSVVQAASAPAWLTPVKGSAMSAPVDESAYSDPADSGSTYRWDSTAQQYVYNWSAKSTAGYYYRVGVKLDDGQTYYVNLGLR